MLEYIYCPKTKVLTEVQAEEVSSDSSGHGEVDKGVEGITEELLLQALRDTRPSVTEKELRKYQTM